MVIGDSSLPWGKSVPAPGHGVIGKVAKIARAWLGFKPIPESQGSIFLVSTPGSSGSTDRPAHDHDDHGHDHDDHGHDHDDHGHDHDDHGHDHDDHGHDHDDHGHDHDDHGHDHDTHDEHGHDDHGHGGHDDHGHGGHGHDHDHASELRGASRRSLIISLVLISTYMVAEVVGGILSGSLALIADAGHMLTDAAAIAMALFAMWVAEKGASAERTYGYYRSEVIAALLNGLTLWLIVGWILWEAYQRFRLDEHHVEGLSVLLVGIGGLVINIIVAYILHRNSEHSLNVEGAFQHVLADLLGSVGVVIAGIIILTVGWTLIDPILSVVIGLLIMRSSWSLTMKVFHVLLEGTPKHIDVYNLCNDIEELDGVTLIHDVHCWTITSGSDAFTAHVLVDPSYQGSLERLRNRIQDITHNRYNIAHVTVQLEQTAAACTGEDHHVEHLLQAQK